RDLVFVRQTKGMSKFVQDSSLLLGLRFGSQYAQIHSLRRLRNTECIDSQVRPRRVFVLERNSNIRLPPLYKIETHICKFCPFDSYRFHKIPLLRRTIEEANTKRTTICPQVWPV